MSTPSFRLTVDDIELTLVEFDGEEEMNRLFKYSFITEIPTTGEKLVDVIDGDAVFTIKEYDTTLHTGDIEIPGYIVAASRSAETWTLEFQPKLNKTTTNRRAEIYFSELEDLTALSVIESEFDNDILLNDRNTVFDITGDLPQRKLFCQMHESNFDFVARLCDHWGFHFYFDHITIQLVFANNLSYDKFLSVRLKTTSSTADNSNLKILNWSETVAATENYVTIIGHNHDNARTQISASYPDAGSRPGTLTELSETLADINSQEEADYIAQVRHEANTCRKSLARGTAQIPYIFPGFEITTDDTEFSTALVIKTTIRARNLNDRQAWAPNGLQNSLALSGNNQPTLNLPATFECDFEAIPANVLLRPNNHYPVPTATNVYGKIISESSNMDVAQRNRVGEYKVELLGFENESSVHPWLRKIQSSAGVNSVDVPLLPDTGVLISFVDNNPNCPLIQNAIENSLHPAPVTNANPHHAVLKTGGMLVTSSLEGRYNFTTTSRALAKDGTYNTTDNDISPSAKNYLEDRGRFDQNTNFIDPSSTTAVVFSEEDEASGNYIFTRFSGDSVEIRQGDKMHWHNGNIYDFGGYWNYNLGNSYEENFIDQEAPLNIKVAKDSRTGDILTPNGPGWESIDFKAIQLNSLSASDVKPPSYGETAIETDRSGKTFKINTDGAWGSGGMNVSKSYNASYDYKFGEGIDISDRVNSLEITHTDGATTAIEMNIHKGVLRSWEKTVGRNSDEKKWAYNGNKTYEGSASFDSTTNTKTEKETTWDVIGDTKISDSSTTTTPNSITTDEKSFNMDTGALATHNIKTTNGMATAEMDFSFDATAASNFNFGASTSFSISAQAEASLAISLSGGVSIKLEAGINLVVELSGGMTFEVKKDVGGLYKLENGKFVAETEATILAATTAATVKAMGPVIKDTKMEIKNNVALLRKDMIALDQANVKLDTSYLIVFA
jgi:uncharacterized protein involved in type VI secretion and phage assembly